jgi:hypothetical protein
MLNLAVRKVTARLYEVKFKPNLLVKGVFFLLNGASAREVLDSISRMHLASIIIRVHN